MQLEADVGKDREQALVPAARRRQAGATAGQGVVSCEAVFELVRGGTQNGFVIAFVQFIE
jgi:hypothetical protein